MSGESKGLSDQIVIFIKLSDQLSELSKYYLFDPKFRYISASAPTNLVSELNLR